MIKTQLWENYFNLYENLKFFKFCVQAIEDNSQPSVIQCYSVVNKIISSCTGLFLKLNGCLSFFQKLLCSLGETKALGRVQSPVTKIKAKARGGHAIFTKICFQCFAIPTKFCILLYNNMKFSGQNIGENQKILRLKKRYFLIAYCEISQVGD